MSIYQRIVSTGVLAIAVSCATPSFAQTTENFASAPYNGGSNSLARGYYFVAPEAFTITSLLVSPEASGANQWAEVIRLNTLPPLYSNTTTDYTNLGYFANQSGSSSIATSIQFLAGDIVGILGDRNNGISYGTQPYVTTLGGLPVTLSRLGSQQSLVAGAAGGVFTELASSSTNLGRISFTYIDGVAGAVPEPASWAMMILGMGAVGFALRSAKRRSDDKFDAKIKKITHGTIA